MKPSCARSTHRSAAFTLIELLTVIAILALLAALGSRTLYAAKERGRIVQCRVELVYLAHALAEYKRVYGEFPFAASSVDLSASRLFSAIAEGAHADVSKFPTATIDTDRVVFVDPWGTPYVYAFRTEPGAVWGPEGFILFSAGPDGASVEPDAAGRFAGGRHTAPVNADNLYADDPV